MTERNPDPKSDVVTVTMLLCGAVLVLGGHTIGGALIGAVLSVYLNRD